MPLTGIGYLSAHNQYEWGGATIGTADARDAKEFTDECALTPQAKHEEMFLHTIDTHFIEYC